jgi:CheY-like chemotaxis protein
MAKTPSVLLLDPDSSFRLDVGFLLKKIGYNAFDASDSEKGLALVLKELPSLVLVSAHLEPTNGFEFCRTLKENSRDGRIEVAIVGTSNSSRFERLLAACGADYWLTKPFSTNDLGADLYHLFHSRNAETPPALRVLERLDPNASLLSHQLVEPVVDTPAHRPAPRVVVATSAPATDTPMGHSPRNESMDSVHQLLLSLSTSLYQTNEHLNTLISYIEDVHGDRVRERAG